MTEQMEIIQELSQQGETSDPFPAQATTETATSGTLDVCNIGPVLGEFYTREEFYECFKSGFQFAGDNLHIQSLPIKPEEELGARKTADKLYDAASKYKFLQFMIDKKSGWVVDTALVVMFVTKKTKDVVEEKISEKTRQTLFGGVLKWFKKGKTASESASSAQAAAEKQRMPENLSPVATA